MLKAPAEKAKQIVLEPSSAKGAGAGAGAFPGTAVPVRPCLVPSDGAAGGDTLGTTTVTKPGQE